MRATLFTLLIAACDNSWGYGAGIDPGIVDLRWRNQVILAVADWNQALGPCVQSRGERALHFEQGGWPVKLYDGHDWPDDLSGRFDGSTVQVRTGLTAWEYPILVHELGHALGFDHISEKQDPDSIMNPGVYSSDHISRQDIERGLDFFGCR